MVPGNKLVQRKPEVIAPTTTRTSTTRTVTVHVSVVNHYREPEYKVSIYTSSPGRNQPPRIALKTRIIPIHKDTSLETLFGMEISHHEWRNNYLQGMKHWHRDSLKNHTAAYDHGEELGLALVHHNQGSGSAAILRLPAEIMSEIFKLSQPDSISHNHCMEKRETSYWCWSGSTLTHICRYWRGVALDTKQLWASIHIEVHANLKHTDLYLERSGAFPLYIYYEGEGSCSCVQECLSSTLRHVHRIRELHLHNIHLSENLLQFLSSPAPMLENLTLKMASNATIDIKPFFAGKAAKLTNLSIFANLSTWESIPILHNLGNLYVSIPLILEQLFQIILQNSRLETLSVSSLPTIGDVYDFPHVHSRIKMPNVKNLVVRDADFLALNWLLASINLPAESNWNICCKAYPFDARPSLRIDPKSLIPRTYGGDFPVLKLVICPYFVNITAIADSSGTVEYCHQVQQERSVTYLSESRDGLASGEEPTRITITLSDAFDFVRSVVEGEFGVLRYCSATTLVLELFNFVDEDERDGGVESELWIPLLKLFPDLCNLTVRCTRGSQAEVVRTVSFDGLFNALGSPLDNNLNGDLLCPKLSQLHLAGLNLKGLRRVQSILENLKNRESYGKRLDLLRVTDLPRSKTKIKKNLDLLKISRVARTIEVVI